jgi:hypothetical protein
MDITQRSNVTNETKFQNFISFCCLFNWLLCRFEILVVLSRWSVYISGHKWMIPHCYCLSKNLCIVCGLLCSSVYSTEEECNLFIYTSFKTFITTETKTNKDTIKLKCFIQIKGEILNLFQNNVNKTKQRINQRSLFLIQEKNAAFSIYLFWIVLT